MTVLVLGADGFLGRHIVDAALARQVDVVGLVRREGDGGRQSLPAAVTRRWFDPETSGPDGVRKMLAELRPRSLINAAGATRGDLVRLADSNVSLVATLVEGLTSGGSQDRTCRLVHVGSGAEYAARPQGTSTGTADLTDPVTPYGVTKLAGTKLVTIAADRGQIDGTVVRVFNPIGPHAPAVGLSGGTVASLSEAIAASRKTLETGDLSAFRDFIDVRDAADLIVAAALKPGPPPPRILNAGTGQAVTARDLVRSLVKISGWEGEVREAGAGSPASLGVDWQQADISVSIQELGWRPSRSLEQSLTDLWGSRA